MNILCIAGATSKTGKTTLITRLIPLLPGWAVCKVTACIPHPQGRCPRGQSETCGICDDLAVPWVIIDDPAVIAAWGTDTGKYAAAGADRILWVQSRPEELPAALNEVQQRLAGSRGIIFEGNHVLAHLKPDYALMMAGSGRAMKPSAQAVKHRVDLLVAGWDFDQAIRVVLERFGAGSVGSGSPGLPADRKGPGGQGAATGHGSR